MLTYLLGLGNVRNYDGSWTEWGNKVGAPIERARNSSCCVLLVLDPLMVRPG